MYEIKNTTVKTYRVAKLLNVVKKWNEAVRNLDTVLDEYNHERQKIVADRMASFLKDGVYQDDDGNTVDWSTHSLVERICELEVNGNSEHSGFKALSVGHNFNLFTELELQLKSLEGNTVEMTDDEVEVIFQLDDLTSVEEQKRKYS